MNGSNFSYTQSDELTTLFWPQISIAYGVEVLITIHIITMLISIPGNLLTIIVILKSKSLLEESAYLLICSVSVADFFVSIFSQPLNVAVLIIGTHNIRNITHLVLYFCIWGFCGASAFGVVCITLDRFLYIMYPMHYTAMLSRKRTYIMIAVQWLCGLGYGVLPLINIKDSAYPTAVAALVTLILMTACMAVVYKQVHQNITRLNRQQLKQHSKRKQNNATITIAFIVLAFFICWFPYIITNFIHAAGDYNSRSPIRAIYYWFVGLGCWNSAFNVFIYGFKNSTLKHEMKKFLGWKRFRVEPSPISSRKEQYKEKAHKRTDSDASTGSRNEYNTDNAERQVISPTHRQAYATFNKSNYPHSPIQQIRNIHNGVKALVIQNIKALSAAEKTSTEFKSPLTTHTEVNSNKAVECTLESFSSEDKVSDGDTSYNMNTFEPAILKTSLNTSAILKTPSSTSAILKTLSTPLQDKNAFCYLKPQVENKKHCGHNSSLSHSAPTSPVFGKIRAGETNSCFIPDRIVTSQENYIYDVGRIGLPFSKKYQGDSKKKELWETFPDSMENKTGHAISYTTLRTSLELGTNKTLPDVCADSSET
ncbi:D(1C) dopamine receptor-like [Hydractinia symbiolongicarpus]|uniref:D(1C) dopamine receptor-like n=1 Tax=Hydractinia symbiolongicarpus TaxID=13093 RepID=UPI002549CC20|nr:D(1C) dopamine receptor-like [Hydractinia symbiolongicarpus]XP_057301289.1 D(1C) dopamine receptor-like [Hydractinia symbiolongicarpus]